jgi:MFS family permease
VNNQENGLSEHKQTEKLLSGLKKLDRNIQVYFLSVLLMSLGSGIIMADFNLYILSLGISPEFLGIVLSLTPLAQAFAAIPIGFLAEKIGNRRALILVNTIVGLSYFLRVITPSRTLILFGSFLLGTVKAGYFVVKMPFISHYSGENKDREFIYSSIILFAALAIGNFVGGFLPSALESFFLNETITYRAILLASATLILSATIPLYFLDKDDPKDTRNISLSPYLKGIDANTVRFACIQFFVGSGLAFLMLFMNIIFVFFYNSNLQAFGFMSAILVIPTVIFLVAGPLLAKKHNSFALLFWPVF